MKIKEVIFFNHYIKSCFTWHAVKTSKSRVTLITNTVFFVTVSTVAGALK